MQANEHGKRVSPHRKDRVRQPKLHLDVAAEVRAVVGVGGLCKGVGRQPAAGREAQMGGGAVHREQVRRDADAVVRKEVGVWVRCQLAATTSARVRQDK